MREDVERILGSSVLDGGEKHGDAYTIYMDGSFKSNKRRRGIRDYEKPGSRDKAGWGFVVFFTCFLLLGGVVVKFRDVLGELWEAFGGRFGEVSGSSWEMSGSSWRGIGSYVGGNRRSC